MVSSTSPKKDAHAPTQLAFQPSGCTCSVLLVSLAVLSVPPVLAVLSFRIATPNWQRCALGAFTILSVLAMAELAMKVALERVFFAPDGLISISVKHLRRHRKLFPRSEILSVTWEKGGGVFLRLRDGQWAPLPGVGRTHQGLVNSVRAWLNRTSDLSPEQ